MADERKCAHEMCDCIVTDESPYCGDHCKEAAAQDIIEIKCDCGHDSCEA